MLLAHAAILLLRITGTILNRWEKLSEETKFKSFPECSQFWNISEKSIPERQNSKFRDSKVETHFFLMFKKLSGKKIKMPACLD